MKKHIATIIIILLIGIAVVTSLKYIAVKTDLREAKDSIAFLDKQNKTLRNEIQVQREIENKLKAEKQALEAHLAELNNKLDGVSSELTQTKSQLAALNNALDVISKENLALQQGNANLETEIQILKSLKQELEAKVYSRNKLKKKNAPAELKGKLTAKAGMDESKSKDQMVIEGNRGFLVRDGKSTFNSRVNIEVIPTE